MSQCLSRFLQPNPAPATAPGNSHPLVAMSRLLYHSVASDANTPSGIHDATTVGSIADATLCDHACDANTPANIHEITRPSGPMNPYCQPYLVLQ